MLMKIFSFFLPLFFLLSCNSNKDNMSAEYITKQKGIISATLDSFNIAAAHSDFNGYFKFFTDSAIFIGTDATEKWNKTQFMKWAKPYFDRKATWNFKAIKRDIYFNKDPDIAWFDELLNTQMKICRGSGVMVKQNGGWKIEQYVLSMTIPNNTVSDILKIKSPIEDSLIGVLSRGY